MAGVAHIWGEYPVRGVAGADTYYAGAAEAVRLAQQVWLSHSKVLLIQSIRLSF